MRTRFTFWAASALFLNGGIAGFEPQWPAADIPARMYADASGLAVPLLRARPSIAQSPDIPASRFGELIKHIPVCILWDHPWAGELGDTLLFRIHEIDRQRISVGYFAYWSTERPWGNNSLTRWFVPALAIDAFYSHLFFVLPGMQRLLYGPGDVEGVRVTYDIKGLQQLVPVSIIADNEQHREEVINVSEAVDESGRILLFNAVWSHQLGGHNAVKLSRAGASRHCYQHATLKSLSEDTVAAFRLGSREDPRRAGPAWGSAEAL
jgi:hypothetical protein